jgi:hypothetical protein
MVQSAQDWCGDNYSRSFGRFVLAAQHIRRITARVRRTAHRRAISDNRCGASVSQHQKPEDDYLPSSAQSSHLRASRMAPAHAASPDWLPTPFHHLTIAHRHQTIPVPSTHSPSFCLVQPERRVRILGCDGGDAQSPRGIRGGKPKLRIQRRGEG